MSEIEKNELREKFSSLAKARSGKISMQELKTGADKEFFAIYVKIFDLLDHNGDGLVTIDELIETQFVIQVQIFSEPHKI
jgi:Ca2+-binding EF-hand superfamily protein